MFKLRSQSWITRFVAIAIVAIVLAGCGAGAPSVNHPTVAPSSSNNTIDAPTDLTPTPNVASMGDAEPTGAPVLPPTVVPTPTPTVVNVSVGGENSSPEISDTPTAEPEPTVEATERPAPPDPTDPGVSDVYDTGTSGRKEIALTFDGGSDRGFAEEILDILEEYNIDASFGITGEWAQANPDLVQRMYEAGYQIFNHTWSHQSFTGASTGEGTGVTDSGDRADELSETNDEIGLITGGYDTRPYWRPPYGDYDEGVLEDVAADGYTVTVRWSCDTLGWNGATVDDILHECTTNMAPGDIILMHVGDGSLDYKALPQMIETLQAEGFTFVTIEQLLQP